MYTIEVHNEIGPAPRYAPTLVYYVNGDRIGSTVKEVKAVCPGPERSRIASACQRAKEDGIPVTVAMTLMGWGTFGGVSHEQAQAAKSC